MKTYTVLVEEIYFDDWEIKASSSAEAEKIAQKRIHDRRYQYSKFAEMKIVDVDEICE